MIRSQFTYCPLVWMFCSRTSNNLIYKTHECSLRLSLNDRESSFVEIFLENKDISDHLRNVTPLIMEGMFNTRPNNYNWRTFQELVTETLRSFKIGLETISYRAP